MRVGLSQEVTSIADQGQIVANALETLRGLLRR
jgi:hypothetical protein